MKQIITDATGLIVTAVESNIRQPDALVLDDTAVWEEIRDNPGRRRWVDGELVAYEPPAPTAAEARAAMPSLTPRQLWLAAARIGVTKEQVMALVDAMEDQEAAADLRIEITEATSYRRSHPATDDLATLLDIPAEQFDDLWLWASQF